MVRTSSSPAAIRIDPSRILAFSTAIALHLLAAALLLIPLAYRAAPALPKPDEPRWVLPAEITPPPTPPPAIEQLSVREPPPVPTFPIEARIPLPEPIAPAVDATPSIAAPTTSTAAPATAISSPAPAVIDGVQLQYLQAPPPSYPSRALRDRQQGTVLLRVLVGVDGTPIEVSVQGSSGHRLLDQAARAQVLRHWRFRPAMRDGVAVQAVGVIPLEFSLQ